MDCSAVYHYCRSVLILKPFASGFDNLRLVFDRNLRAYSALSEEPSMDSDALSQAEHKKSLIIRAQSFFIRFVRLHGDLFSWTHATAASITDRQQASITATTELLPYAAEKFDVQKCTSLIQKILTDFEFFMRYDEASIFSEMLLVRLLAIALFSVHYGSSIHGERAASEPLDSSITESLALYFLFNFISR
jgi:Est1 DNA/RNA binding domain